MRNTWVVRHYPSMARPAFARYLLGQTLSGIGTWFQIVAQSLLVLQLAHRGSALGAAASLQFLPMLLLSPYAGVLLDRIEARKLLLVTSICACALALGLGLLVTSGHVSVHGVWAFALGLGLVQTFDRTGQSAMLAELVPMESRGNATALASVQNASGRLIGPAIAGVLYAWQGPALCFYLNAASYLLIIYALAAIPRDQRIKRPRRHSNGALADLRAGLSYVRSTPAVRAPLVCAGLIGLMAFNFIVVMPALVTFTFHGGGREFGIVEAINAGAAVIGGLILAPRLKHPTRRRLAIATTTFSVGLLGCAVMPTFLTFMLWMPVFGGTFIFFQTALQSLLQTKSNPAYLGRVMSLYTLAMFGTTPFGALLAGWLVDHHSARAAMAMSLLATIPCAAWLGFVTPGHDPADEQLNRATAQT